MKRFEYESYTEWYGGKYSTFTKVFDWEKADSTWRGCHWDNPAIIKAEVVEGEIMSDEMSAFITSIGATEIVERNKNEIVGMALQRFFASEVEVEELKEKEV